MDNESCEDFAVSQQKNEPQLFTQAELNNLVRKLDLPKSSAELHESTFAHEIKSAFTATGKYLTEFFKMEEDFLFCDT